MNLAEAHSTPCFLIINKPPGPTSHDVVQTVRRGTGERRVGHGGTLDPLASGVLVVALGAATRLLEYVSGAKKAYRAEFRLGITTDTNDAEGTALSETPLSPHLSPGDVEIALESFRGEILQIPPQYSAIKVAGKPAYQRARAGTPVDMKPRPVTVYELDLITFQPPNLTVDIVCSAGTYIRSIARDLGEQLGCGALLSALVRTASGNIKLADSVSLEVLVAAFESDTWRTHLTPPDRVCGAMPKVTMSGVQVEAFRAGKAVAMESDKAGHLLVYAPNGALAGVGIGDPDRASIQPKKVFPVDHIRRLND